MVNNINPNIIKNNLPFQDIQNLVALLERHSINCIWEQSYRCPCFTQGAPKSDCPYCKGQGFLYQNPVELGIAITSDEKQILSTSDGELMPLGSVATPQITSNGIEQGIKPGDRITVMGWDTPQNYVVNITPERASNGIFIPYKVNTIEHAYIIDKSQGLTDIKDSLFMDGDLLKVKDNSLIGRTISLCFSVIKRFYVVALDKELRYAQFKKPTDKRAATGYGNEYVSFKQLQDNKFPDGVQVFRMPSKLLLRRENLYFPDTNIIQDDKDFSNNVAISNPVINDIESIIGG